MAVDTKLSHTNMSEQGLLAEGGTPYTGVGAALDVSFSGTYSDLSPYSASSSTLSNLLTPGVSYSVENASTVTWTANVLVSPPADVATLSFSVNFPVTDWKPVAVADPLGVLRTNPTEWYQNYDEIIVTDSAVDTHGVWKLTFTAVNHLDDLVMGQSGGPYYPVTTTFDTGDTARFGVSSSWITGAGAEFDLIDPSGNVRYTLTDTTSGSEPNSHVLPSYRYHKTITINNLYVTGDLTNFPVLIDIIDSDLDTNAQPDGDDIVFYSNGVILSHEIELFDPNYSATQAHLVAWVKANLSDLVDTTITMYYGNPVVGPQSRPNDVWTTNYAAVWHLSEAATDEGTSAIHLDSTGNGYYGNQVGNADDTGIFATGQRFDGTNDVINVTATRGLEPSGDVTISGWFKLDSLINQNQGVTQVLLTKAIDGNTDVHILIAGSDYSYSTVPRGAMVFKMENGGLGQKYVWSTRRSWNAGEWYFFTCTMDASTPALDKIYINGQDRTNSSTLGSLATATFAFTADWKIGGGFVDQIVPPEGYFDGVIDEVRVSLGIRPLAWIQTEWYMYQSSSLFRTLASQTAQTSPAMYIDQVIAGTDPAGLWTISAHYNDSGSSVSHRVGEYQRNFIVRRASILDILSPSDAKNGLEQLVVGDMLYLVIDLSDSANSDPAIGATVSMNWTSPSILYFEDLGDGRYSVARNTSELSDNIRWRIEIEATHPYYIDPTPISFNLDLLHPTELTYEWVTTTPVGNNVDVTLVYRDTWDGSLISGATITLGDGTPVTPTIWGPGRYNVTINADALPPGAYSQIFNATNSAGLYEMASSNVTYLMRRHYTAVSVSGDLITPFGDPTLVTVQIIDLDTGLPLATTGSVSSWSFTSSHAPVTENNPTDFAVALTTSSWPVGPETVTLTVSMSGIYYSPSNYQFDVEIRNHLTAVNVVGDLTSAYGANTTLTIILTDLDGGTITIGSVSSFTFTSSQPIQIYNSPSSFTIVLDTDNWPVSTIAVTLSVSLTGNYDDPINYIFSITIRKLQTTLYNAPTNLLFPRESDFQIIVHFNVTESGVFYGYAIDGEVGQFFSTPYGANFTALGDGAYRVTISWSIFRDLGGSDFTIIIGVNPTSSLYKSASLVVSFQYREIISDLTANLYTVSTPYNMDVTVHLYFTDRDSGIGITTATIFANPDILISAPHVSNGDYLVTLNSSSLAIGSHEINLTASASGYQDKWVIITVIVTQIHTDLEPSVIRLEIPSGNTKIFTITWTDLDNSLAIAGATRAHNWTGTYAPSFVYISGQYQVTFQTSSTDALGTFLVWFNFTKGAEYQPGYCEIQIVIRSHDTILTAETPPPTAYNSIINITVYYYDFDYKVGIKNALVNFTVENATGPVISTFEYNLGRGDGYYTIHISASQFGIGPQTFTIYVIWEGAIQQYENNNVVVAATVEGVTSLMTLTYASNPSAYLEIMTYNFTYSEQDSGIGISNSTNPYSNGSVHISVSFSVPFDMLKITISEPNPVSKPGLYQIVVNTTGFNAIGQFTMTITIDWTGGSPFYDNREESVSVWVLSRDTLLLVNPPSPQSYGEIATFTFNWQDTGTLTYILNSSELTITPDFTTDSLIHNAGTFSVTFNTSQFGSTGIFVLHLDVIWTGAPFYANRSVQISITVLNRQTILDYPTPDPTFYSDNVTITITWTDVTNGGSDGITGATITVSDSIGIIPSNQYDLRVIGVGVYEIELNTTWFASTGYDFALTIQIHVPASYIADKTITRYLDILPRRTILSYEAIGKVAYGEPIIYILYFNDLYTSKSIGNSSGYVTLDILTAGTWIFTSLWDGVEERYVVTITGYPDVGIGVPSPIQFQMTYANVAPFYASDDVTATFQLRERLSLLSLDVAPNPTPYLDNAVFLMQFLDVDADTGIIADDILVFFSLTQLTYGSEYTYTHMGGGYYEISVNSTVLGGTIGQKGIVVEAHWTSGAPYHNNASASVNIRVTTRATIVDITIPPAQTPFLDNATFTFEYVDLSSSIAITSILPTDITLYKNGTFVDYVLGDYTLTPTATGFMLSIDSEILGTGLGRYNLTVVVQAPEFYYVDAQSTTWVTITKRTLGFILDPLEETKYGHQMNITFTVTDFVTGAPVDGAIITFSAQSVPLSLGVNYFITPLGNGEYLIEINTTAFPTPGNFLFNLDIGWNVGIPPYYKALKTIILTGVIGDIETTLTVHFDEVIVDWGSPAPLAVNYTDLVWFNAISGAQIEWESNNLDTTGTFTEFPIASGIYTSSVDTSVADAGRYIISIRASKNNYEIARAYITVIVSPLESDIVIITPVDATHFVDRGSALTITIRLEDVDTNPIANIYVELNGVFVTVEFGGTFYLSYTGTPGEYTVTLPADDETATKKNPGIYDITIYATMRNYEPASTSFKIRVLQTATEVQLSGDTTTDMSRTYTENVTVSVFLVLPDLGYSPFWNATIDWSVVDSLISGNFTNHYNGTFTAIIQTADIGFGIWNIQFKAMPWENASLYAGSSIIISFAIKRIQTSSIPPETRDFYWGWEGYLRFVYWDESFNKGIAGATVAVELPGLTDVFVTDAGNGTYFVYLDTSLLSASNLYIPLPVTFSKSNYAPSSATIQIRVLEVPTDIYVSDVNYTPAYVGELPDFEDLNIVNLQIPYGDSMVITFYYNDTDNSDGFVGGIPGAFLTLNSYLRGPTFDGALNVTLIDLGNGLYQVVFDTLDSDVRAQVGSEAYRLSIEMGLENRSITDILFRVTIINIDTQLTIIEEQPMYNLINGESITIELLYFDTWHGVGIPNANFTATPSRGAQFTVSTEEGSVDGQYFITIAASGIKLSTSSGTIAIRLGDGVFNVRQLSVIIDISLNSTDTLVSTGIVYGLPIILLIAMLGLAYVRVWSVPKRLRQINGMIKTIRKGKVPKPILEAASRQDLIAALFNDTFSKIEIVRTPEDMPEESVPVDVPELGELLIQLAILTNLDQQELDEFKADIVKMKMSEQAAFVKEVIMQEAIRAARREHKTVEEIIEEVEAQATSRLSGDIEGDEAPIDTESDEDDSEIETVILPDREKVPKGDEPDVTTKDDFESVGDHGDKLSPYEIEELKKDLESRGVPLHEIDVIVKQAQTLPRDLVEELIKSLGIERDE